jgi:hypothetical protein
MVAALMVVSCADRRSKLQMVCAVMLIPIIASSPVTLGNRLREAMTSCG